MKEWAIHLPVEGTLIVKICADKPEEALQILEDKQEQILYHPIGKLSPLTHKLTMYCTIDDENSN